MHALTAHHAGLPAALVLAASVALLACNTVDLGDNFAQGEVAIGEDFYYCTIQPQVVTPQGCAEGADGEAGMCHTDQSALRLRVVAAQATCDSDGAVTGMIPPDVRFNFDSARAEVTGTSSTSPFLLRPIGVQAHSRIVFGPDSIQADLIRMWIDGAP